jgi:hypothetical protein
VRKAIFDNLVVDKTVSQGVATIIYTCVAPEVARMTGGYFDNCMRIDSLLSTEVSPLMLATISYYNR